MRKHITRELIASSGYSIYAGGKQILIPPRGFEYPEPIPLPSYLTGSEPKTLPRNIRLSNSITELRKLQFGVYSRPLTSEEQMYFNQRKVYDLARTWERSTFVQQMPKDVSFEHDIANAQVRLLGPGVSTTGVTAWRNIEVKGTGRKPEEANEVSDILKRQEEILQKYESNLLNKPIQKQIVLDTDVPIMITESNEILCIPIDEHDLPRAGVFGATGFAKTVLTHGIVDRMYHYQGIRIAHLNDSQILNGQSETHEWCYPDDERGMSYRLPYSLKKLNEEPSGLPAVYLTPHTEGDHDESTPDSITHEKDGLGYKISLSYADLIINSYRYLDLKESAKYFSIKTKELLQCKTPDELVNVFATGDPELSYEDYKRLLKDKEIDPINTPPEGSIQYVRAIFNDLYTKKIVDRWSGVPSKWDVYYLGKKLGSYNPIMACMIVGAVPILETAELLDKSYFGPYYSSFARDIFNLMGRDPLMKQLNMKTILWIDEFGDIAKGNVKSPQSEITNQLQKKGRFRGIGTFICNQSYLNTPEIIRGNIRQLFLFNTPEADKACYDFLGSGYNSYAKRVKELKRFEFMAYTKDRFKLMDFDGNYKYVQGPIFGTVLPPLSIHSKPRGNSNGNEQTK